MLGQGPEHLTMMSEIQHGKRQSFEWHAVLLQSRHVNGDELLNQVCQQQILQTLWGAPANIVSC